ncbi:MAG: DNA polymerase III subunit delta [Hyphomicrobiaceae bacterium]
MVAIRANQSTSFLAKPDPSMRAVLLYGPDAGLVAERGQKLAKLLAERETPAGEVLRLDDSDLDSDPDRLGVELLTIPMFGGPKIIRAAAGRRINAAVRALLAGGTPAGAIIVEAGELRRDDGLRTVFEKSPNAAAIACYPDEGASLDGLISEVLKAAGMEIAPEARQELTARLGADRALSRSEVEKLALYAQGAERIEIDHVTEIIGDAADMTLDLAIGAAAAGDVTHALIECDRAAAAGESLQSIMLAAERHFHRLHRMRAGLDAGRSMDDLARQMRPPLPIKARAALERQARAWSTDQVALAIGRISEAIKNARTTGADESVLAERLLMEISRLARQTARGRPSAGRH